MKLRFLLLFSLLACLAFFQPTAQASVSAPTLSCQPNPGTGSQTSVSCHDVTCAAPNIAPLNSVIIWEVFNYTPTGGSTVTVNDSTNSYGTDLAFLATTGGAPGEQTHIFSALSTSSSCLTYVTSFSPASTFIIINIYFITGNATSSWVDKTTTNTFTTNAGAVTASQSLLAGDLLMSQVNCATGNIGRTEWNAGTGFTKTSGPSGQFTVGYDEEYQQISTAGSYTASWSNHLNGCIYSDTAWLTFVAYKAASTASTGQVGAFFISKYRPEQKHRPFHAIRIPWDRPKKVIDMERLQFGEDIDT